MTFKHQFVETNGIRMHFAEAGTGFPVLFCHGFPESWYSWRHQLEALAGQGFLAIAPDMRGYGQTERPEAYRSIFDPPSDRRYGRASCQSVQHVRCQPIQPGNTRRSMLVKVSRCGDLRRSALS
jgi:pimeloyl-ACP methyl ester carboxylesterase